MLHNIYNNNNYYYYYCNYILIIIIMSPESGRKLYLTSQKHGLST